MMRNMAESPYPPDEGCASSVSGWLHRTRYIVSTGSRSASFGAVDLQKLQLHRVIWSRLELPCHSFFAGDQFIAEQLRKPKRKDDKHLRRNSMNRRNILVLGLSAVFATALSQAGLSQSDFLIGAWKLNLEKSKFSPGPPPKSQTLNFQRAGQDLQNTAETVDAQGQASKIVFMHIYDGKPHPTTGNPLFDATTYTRVDDHHVKWVRSKADKPVQTGTNEISADGKTFTVSTEGIGPNGQPISSVGVYEKQ